MFAGLLVTPLKVRKKSTKFTQQAFTCSKVTLKTPEQCPWRRSGDFIVNFEHISHVVSIGNFEYAIAGWVVFALDMFKITATDITNFEHVTL